MSRRGRRLLGDRLLDSGDKIGLCHKREAGHGLLHCSSRPGLLKRVKGLLRRVRVRRDLLSQHLPDLSRILCPLWEAKLSGFFKVRQCLTQLA